MTDQARLIARHPDRYRGVRLPPGGRVRLIARQLLRSRLRQRATVALLLVALLPGLAIALILYLKNRLASGVLPGTLAEELLCGLVVRPYGVLLLGFFMALFAGGGAIADDARAGGFQIYFARPVSAREYGLGKLAALFALVGATVLGSVLVAALAELGLAHFGAELVHALDLSARAVVLGAVEALALSAPVLALSAMARSRAAAQGAFALVFLLPWVVGDVLSSWSRSPWPLVFSLPAQMDGLGRALFGLATDPQRLPAWAAAVSLAAVIGGSLALLHQRLGAADVVGS